MYKIYINNCPLIIATRQECISLMDTFPEEYESQCLRFQKSLISNYVDKLEKQKDPFALCLYAKDAKKAYRRLKKYFKVIKAAGALVVNKQEEILMIYRNNCWDLPKGKIEGSELPKEAAIREVKEETGLTNMKLRNKITKTRHVYQLRDEQRRILKITHWYLMTSQDNQFEPQSEEGITRVEWVKKNLVLISHKPIFNNLIDVMRGHLV